MIEPLHPEDIPLIEHTSMADIYSDYEVNASPELHAWWYNECNEEEK